MKTTLLLAALAGLSYTLWVDFHPQAISAKSATPEYLRRRRAEDARIADVLGAFRRGDPAREAEAWRVMAGLRASDRRRLDFADALIGRGHARPAFDLARVYAHFGEYSLPNDREMVRYARLAERTGHEDEAAWARERMGTEGHFRVWTAGTDQRFAHDRSLWPLFKDTYEHDVNSEISEGLGIYPQFRERLEVLRRRLLSYR